MSVFKKEDLMALESLSFIFFIQFYTLNYKP
jgi:hypothetical protein